jgi:hypothetical protein
MGRTKGANNKVSTPTNRYALLLPSERMQLLANIIVDVILIDQKNSSRLLKQARKQCHARSLTN